MYYSPFLNDNSTMTTFGKLQEFCPEEVQFSAYMERANIYFVANDIPEAKQVPVFLNAVGRTTYGLLRNLLSPADPITKTLKEITDTLKQHFEPKPLIVVERYHFHERNQAPEESIAQYVAELCRLAAKCKFRENQDEALRDCLVGGVASDSIRKDYSPRLICQWLELFGSCT